MYNKNIYCNYILFYIMTTNILLYMKMYFYYTSSCTIKYLLSLYAKMYFCYIREYIINIFLLYTLLYNDNKYYHYT